MKKILLIMSLALVAFASCDKNNDKPADDTVGVTEVVFAYSELQIDETLVSAEVKDEYFAKDSVNWVSNLQEVWNVYYTGSKITLKSDSTFTAEGIFSFPKEDVSLTYVISDDAKSITLTGDSVSVTGDYSETQLTFVVDYLTITLAAPANVIEN